MAAGAEPPERWAACPRVRVDDAALERPQPLIASLHTAWAGREPLVVEMVADPERLREPELDTTAVHDLLFAPPGFRAPWNSFDSKELQR